jgi:hypothetical protein
MPFLDPQLMGIFREKIRDPECFRHVHKIMRACRAEDLATSTGAYGVVDKLSGKLGVPISPAQRENAAQWLMQCGVDPQNSEHRYAMWDAISF